MYAKHARLLVTGMVEWASVWVISVVERSFRYSPLWLTGEGGLVGGSLLWIAISASLDVRLQLTSHVVVYLFFLFYFCRPRGVSGRSFFYFLSKLVREVDGRNKFAAAVFFVGL